MKLFSKEMHTCVTLRIIRGCHKSLQKLAEIERAEGGHKGLTTSMRQTRVTCGIPDDLASDGGLEFTAHETQRFLKAWGGGGRGFTTDCPLWPSPIATVVPRWLSKQSNNCSWTTQVQMGNWTLTLYNKPSYSTETHQILPRCLQQCASLDDPSKTSYQYSLENTDHTTHDRIPWMQMRQHNATIIRQLRKDENTHSDFPIDCWRPHAHSKPSWPSSIKMGQNRHSYRGLAV